METKQKRAQRACMILTEAPMMMKHQYSIAWTSQIKSSLLLILFLVLVSGCVMPVPGDRRGSGSQPGTGSPPSPRTQIGTLRVIKGSVTLNRARALDNTPVYSGDKLATGPSSAARVDFPGYGSIHLDENTDPILEAIVQESCRVLIRILQFGSQVWGTGTGLCEEDPNGVFVALNSSVNLRVLRGRSVITVVEGTATVLRPGRTVLRRGQQVEVVSGKPSRVVTLSEPELRAVYSWLSKSQTIK